MILVLDLEAFKQPRSGLPVGAIGFVVGGFDFGHRVGVESAAKETFGERAADAFVKEDQEQSNAGAFISEAVGVASTVAQQQSVGFHFAQFVAPLGKGVSGGSEAEAGNNGVIDLGSASCQEIIR